MITVDSNAPYTTAFEPELAKNAVYLAATDPLLGEVLAIVYTFTPGKLSVILLGNHGTSGYVDMTLDASSRYFGACRALAPAHASSRVRRALAIAVLRTFSTMDRPLLRFLVEQQGHNFEKSAYMYDETAAGVMGSAFKLVFGKLPRDLGLRVLESGVLTQKALLTSVVDVVYNDSDETIDQDNELVYSLGSQLEQLFNPLTEYSPEPTEQLYEPPKNSTYTLMDDPQEAQAVCEELFMVQSHQRTALVDFHQNFLVPMRIAVLRGEIPELTISRLNSVFPPTFDEVLRINNLFYNALQAALPYGSFEVLRACGITLPYFYRALMRHEAATQDFDRLKHVAVPEFRARIEEYGPQRIDSVVRASLNLAQLKMLLDRLASAQTWPPQQRDLVQELHEVAVATVESFGRAPTLPPYERRTLTPSGKLLSEITSGWPSELEYGWMHNRRVVAIFDGTDVLEENRAKQQLQHIMVLFTDVLIILQPQRPIPMTSISGLRIPYIGDMLMHSLLNQVPLDYNLPQLRVIAWQNIANLTFTSFNNDRFLQISSLPHPFRIGRDNVSDKNMFSKTYRLTQPDQGANKLAEILTKTKIATKLQDLHIFKFTTDQEPDVAIYATVHELGHYVLEKNRFPVCLFMNQDVSKRTLDECKLAAAIGIRYGTDEVQVSVVSRFNYSASHSVPWANYQYYVVSEICYLMTLYLSSQNKLALSSIVGTNLQTSRKLVSWAQAGNDRPFRSGHRRHPNMSKDLRVTTALTPVVEETPSLQQGAFVRPRAPYGPPPPVPNAAQSAPNRPKSALGPVFESSPESATESIPGSRGTPGAPGTEPSSNLSETYSGEINVPRVRDTKTPGETPGRLKKKENFSFEQNRDRSYRELAKRPSIASYGVGAGAGSGNAPSTARNSSLPSMASHSNETAIVYQYGDDTVSDFQEYNDGWESVSEDDGDQRNVDEWFQQLDKKDGHSLSTSMSEDELSLRNRSRSSSKATETSDFQIGGFLDERDSMIYNSHAGENYPALHSRNTSDASNWSQTSGGSTASAAPTIRSTPTDGSTPTDVSRRSSQVPQEYSWLAGMVHSHSRSTIQSEAPSPERGPRLAHKRSTSSKLYAGLRESSIVGISSFLVSSDTSQSIDLLALLQHNDSKHSVLGSNEPTPKLT